MVRIVNGVIVTNADPSTPGVPCAGPSQPYQYQVLQQPQQQQQQQEQQEQNNVASLMEAFRESLKRGSFTFFGRSVSSPSPPVFFFN